MTESIDFEQLMEQQRQLLKEIQSGDDGGPLSASMSSLTSAASSSSSGIPRSRKNGNSRNSTTNSNNNKKKTKTTASSKNLNGLQQSKPIASSVASNSPEPFVAYGWTFERLGVASKRRQQQHRHQKKRDPYRKKSQKQRRHERDQAEEWISDWHFERVPGGKPPLPPSFADVAALGKEKHDRSSHDQEEVTRDNHLSGHYRSSTHSRSTVDDNSSCYSGTPQLYFERIPDRNLVVSSSRPQLVQMKTNGDAGDAVDHNDDDVGDDDDMMLEDDVDVNLPPDFNDVHGFYTDDISLEDLIVAGDDDDDNDDDDNDDNEQDHDDVMATDGMVHHQHHHLRHHPTPQTGKMMHESSLTAATAPMDDAEMDTPTSSTQTTPYRHNRKQSVQLMGTPPRLPCAEGMDDMFKSTLQKLTASMKRTAETRQSLTIKTSQTKEYERSLCLSQILQSVQSSSAQVDTCLQIYQQHTNTQTPSGGGSNNNIHD